MNGRGYVMKAATGLHYTLDICIEKLSFLNFPTTDPESVVVQEE
jgi:hypothetical protein